jgi:hypothetical protein
MWGALSDERTVLPFTIVAGPRQRSQSRVPVPRDSWPHFTVRFETPLIWRARSPYLYPPGTGWSSFTPRHFVPFSLSATTRRATVEVLKPASTRHIILFHMILTIFREFSYEALRTVQRRMVGWWMGKDWEGSGRGLIDVVSRRLPGRTEEDNENLIQRNRCSLRDSNLAPANTDLELDRCLFPVTI